MDHIRAPEFRGTVSRYTVATRLFYLGMAAATVLICRAAMAEPVRLRTPPEQIISEFSLEDVDGRSSELSAVNSDAIIVHFFATWCEPCREEFATLEHLAKSGRNVKILAISVAEPPVRVKRFAEALQVTFPILLDADRRVAKTWGVTALPTTYILDRMHVARLFVEGDLDWRRADVLAALDDVVRASNANSNR